MGIFSRLKFWKRKKEEPVAEMSEPRPEITAESSTVGNVRAKMDLVMTQIDSLRTQHEVLSERVKNIERMVSELYAMAKS